MLKIRKKPVKSNSTSNPQNEVRCFTTNSDSHSKRKDRKCRLPAVDPEISKSWHQESMSQVDLLSYTLGIFNDLIPKELAKCWSKQLGRLVELPEKEDVTALTQSEMDVMRKRYSECEVNVKQYHVDPVKFQSQDLSISSFSSHVSTACFNSRNKILKSPHINIVIGQIGNKNLQSCPALLDSGSDISLISMAMVQTYNIDLSPLEKLSNNIILRGSIGSLKNPFKGILKVMIRIWNHKVLTPPILVSFHVLKENCDLKVPMLGISFLKENHCTLNFFNDTFKVKTNKRLISIKTKSRQSKYSSYVTHNQDVSSDGLIQCTCNSLIS